MNPYPTRNTLAREAQADDYAADAEKINRKIAEILTDAAERIRELPTDGVPCAADGYDWESIMDMLTDMTPKLDREGLRAIAEWARAHVEDC